MDYSAEPAPDYSYSELDSIPISISFCNTEEFIPESCIGAELSVWINGCSAFYFAGSVMASWWLSFSPSSSSLEY